MANEVAKLIGGDVAPPESIDRATQLGAGFPDGPVTMADDYGLDDLLETLEEAHEEERPRTVRTRRLPRGTCRRGWVLRAGRRGRHSRVRGSPHRVSG
ncbi:3-hydroxyacyl-CoA dehydrogenase family protein [Natrarchaeobaculum aegyptiacum]|uniref:3-hydroxyacyl-CoA dehydrogenase family protein n=1 Tax=Natrarchaeobaculum aegyptiacum TaxID=745377 RepID=UPI0037445CE8